MLIMLTSYRYGVLVDPTILLVFLEDPYNWPSASLSVCRYLQIPGVLSFFHLVLKLYSASKFVYCMHDKYVNILLFIFLSSFAIYDP